MGIKKYINRILKKENREKEPDSATLFRKLQAFYEKHPHASPTVSREVDKIRKECDKVMGLLQQDFDKQHEETTVVFLKMELEFVTSFLADGSEED